jgi:arabinogalactan oligomer/maltooligosaccharide transport system permease protein
MNVWHWLNYDFIGLKNYGRAFTALDSGFIAALFRTILWTAVNLVLQVVLALFISLLLNIDGLKGKGIYKTIMMFSWAMPSYISALIWRSGMFHNDFGLLNQILRLLGLEGVKWLNTNFTAFLSCIMVNLWISLPYMILVFFGGLQGIDNVYYETAMMEGATFWNKIRYITVPLLKPIVMPAIILTALLTFRQFDIIYLMTIQLDSGANIHTVITYAYENAFITNNYGYSSALSVIIFLIIAMLTIMNQKSLKGED